MYRFCPAIPLAVCLCLCAHAQKAGQSMGVLGDWREPGGSILEVFPCGPEICMRVMTLRPNTPHFDTRDPDPAKRALPLCGFRIGYGFHPEGATKAVGGHVYDPQSGNTYHGEMHSTDDTLHLRGYVLMSLLGRTEKWQRVPAQTEPCHEH